MTAAEAKIVLALHESGWDVAPPEKIELARATIEKSLIVPGVLTVDQALAALEDEMGGAS